MAKLSNTISIELEKSLRNQDKFLDTRSFEQVLKCFFFYTIKIIMMIIILKTIIIIIIIIIIKIIIIITIIIILNFTNLLG